jgi:peptidoglycan/LPS O-acetylase OafA/YrhL
MMVRDRLVSLQLLRFLAAALVVLCHTTGGLDRLGLSAPGLKAAQLGSFGTVGVDIFFVLSGYIITSSAFVGERKSPIHFIRDRLIRVVPIYYLISALLILSPHHNLDIRALFVTLTFWPALTDGMYMPYITAGWTLCFEMLFYFAAALCLGARYGLAAVSVVFLASMLLRGYSDWVVFQFIGNPIICEFILGASIALCVKPGHSRGFAGGMLLAGAVLGFSLSYYLGFNGIEAAENIMDGTESMRRAVLWGIPSALLLAAFLQFEDKIRNFRFLVMLSVLGDASYATYLIHRSIIYFLEGNVAHLHVVSGYELVVIELCVSFGAGLCVFKMAERPIIRLLRRHLPVEFRVRPVARRVASTDA